MPIVLVMVNVYGKSGQLCRSKCSRLAFVAESLRARMSNLIGLRFRDPWRQGLGLLKASSLQVSKTTNEHFMCNELVRDIIFFQISGQSSARSASCYGEHFQRYPVGDLQNLGKRQRRKTT